MEPRPKALVVWTWIVGIITLIVVAPVTFIMGVFASDNSSGAGNPISYALIFFPIVYPLLMIATQVAYSRGAYRGARILGWIAIALCIISLGLLASVFMGLW